MRRGGPRAKCVPRPEYIWERYYFVRATDGYAIIDRMSDRYSVPNMWVEEIVATFGSGIVVSQVSQIVKRLNRDWHNEIVRRKQCQFSTE